MLDSLMIDAKIETVASRPVSLGPRVTASSAIEFTSPPWLPAAEKRINALLNLQANWDGEGAPRINFDCAMGAFSFLFANSMHETPAPQLVPTSTGGIQVEWHLYGTDLEIRFDPKEPVTYFYSGANGREIEGEVSEELSTVGSLLRALPTRNERIQPSR
jgi:hypothetical protein